MWYFYPRPPRGGRPKESSVFSGWLLFLSTPSARRATQNIAVILSTPKDFYPRPPRGGRRPAGRSRETRKPFLSTPSARRATKLGTKPLTDEEIFLSTPSARRATSERGTSGRACNISIHALREEGDSTALRSSIRPPQFLSTPSARRATVPDVEELVIPDISIHALREEGDQPYSPPPAPKAKFLSTPSARRATYRKPRPVFGLADFYPRPPRGGRHCTACLKVVRKKFLSTPSARRATRVVPCLPADGGNFYPRPPRGGRPITRQKLLDAANISIHALREEGDRTTPALW